LAIRAFVSTKIKGDDLRVERDQAQRIIAKLKMEPVM
jgi:hypothetical protein